MELLGIGVNMQGSGNYPNFYFSGDLKGVVGGCIWPQTSEDKMLNGGHSSKAFLSPLSAGLYFECGRDALKQIMLMQEATFRDQIYELHRLYKRQSEFIAEMKRESNKHDVCITTTRSDFYKSRVDALCAQDAHNFPAYSQLFIYGEQKSSLHSSFGKNIQTGSDTPSNGIFSKTPYFSESKSKILGNGMFDLELPTDRKQLNRRDELTKVPEMSSFHLKRMPDVVHISDKPLLSKHDLNASLHRDSSTADSLFEKTKISVDLNDPPNIEEEPGCRSVGLEDATGHREILFHDLNGKANSKFLVFSEPDVHGRRNGPSNNGYSESISFYDRSKRYQPDKDITNSSLSSSTASMTKSVQGPIGNAMLAEDDLCSVKNSRSRTGSSSVNPLEGSFCNGSKSEIVKEESCCKASANWIEGRIDLNVCINEEFLAAPCCSTEMKLEVPVSPGKGKHSSTTGEFGENQVGSHFLKSVEDDGEPLEDLNAIAAEALVSISSSVAQNCRKITGCQSVQVSWESLCWLAEIVSSMGAEPEKAEVAMKCKDGSDSEELLSNCMDDFEVMTLKLKETVEEECSLTRSNHQEEATKNVSSPSCQLGKGRARRGQRKNFQTEILPSLTTLSRYEVTEDIQTIGGLMEVTSSHSINGAAKTPSRVGTTWTRGKRRLCDSSSKVTEAVLGSIMDQVSSDNEVENKERKVVVWGNITRRRRGRRYPACTRKTILGQV
ncbi:uncharacterized protein LOC111783256 isoform X1 [Cucurbita pepo subsp. pepo]|uniref:uncharacterized protein LOC111783256 isoform X1 n=1 Tax=Cucurbita pepo subsp. pepo TaxID=3664 RepID=UPI000C9D2CDD|nr:uncharacterized protein LOC111783256 isoform X1 [Cucurbita pepo subsp. pepo]XP_023519939.1 uncharacterized protein LOC111783256 isoform X1 [Cucurbita pepo subsp. pepo]